MDFFFISRDKQILLWKGVTIMSTIKKIIVDTLATALVGIASVVGMLAGFTIWGSGLGDKVEEKTRQFFNKES
jgi:hypothetical protein